MAAATGLAVVAQGAGELMAELVAFVSQLADLVVGGFLERSRLSGHRD